MMKKFLIYFLPTLLLFLVLLMPSISFSAGLVPCQTEANPGPCDFNAFMSLIHKVMNFIFLKLAIPIAAIMFAYAGVLLVTSGGSTESRSKAKKIFTDAFTGLVLAAGAWLLVKALLMVVGYKDLGTFFNF